MPKVLGVRFGLILPSFFLKKIFGPYRYGYIRGEGGGVSKRLYIYTYTHIYICKASESVSQSVSQLVL